MSLTKAKVIDYLLKVNSLNVIDNHQVKDDKGNKTGQTTLAIEIGQEWINQILEQDCMSGHIRITENERNALIALREAIDGLPTSWSIQALMSIMDLNRIQNNLFESITSYIASISQVEEHTTLLKAVVLVLKIIEYDLSKKEGPITIGYGFFKMVVLSDEQRKANHIRINELRTNIIQKFDSYYEPEQTCSTSLEHFDELNHQFQKLSFGL
ncbi:hypothetical protein [Legionella bononiensis]|uniref:Substrate of the Dot/Icm secretion system n=1 Tax=Legionella bononiensis TaxID=2793102 RepID=A0ABS1W8Y5_9GAMM|nr:hypothetical protein [Legionella bononiensis]MBL7479666.1 hypothetical protein [Legionella bononiensis]MBL7525822.1 hypothetical protein [Legionella bononiensis]MBL7562004.1 hypothetical protein [Legionella bononiensis]